MTFPPLALTYSWLLSLRLFLSQRQCHGEQSDPWHHDYCLIWKTLVVDNASFQRDLWHWSHPGSIPISRTDFGIKKWWRNGSKFHRVVWTTINSIIITELPFVNKLKRILRPNNTQETKGTFLSNKSSTIDNSFCICLERKSTFRFY